jgi:hypothetical protein
MPQARYITSEAQIGAPGVYIKERNIVSAIRGERNRVVGLVGQCVRGPINKKITCATYQRFIEVFGGRDRNVGGGPILGHVWSALQGYRWGRLEIVRVAASDATVASFTAENHVATLNLGSITAHVNTVLTTTVLAGNSDVTIAFVSSGTGTGQLTRSGNAFTFAFQNNVTTVANFESAVNALTGADDLIDVQTTGTGGNVLTTVGDVVAATRFVTVTNGSTTPVLRIDAANAGSWGNDVQFRVLRASDGNPKRFNLHVKMYGSVQVFENIDISAGQNNIATVFGDDDGLLVTLTKLSDGIPSVTEPNLGGADSTAFVALGTTAAGFTSVIGTDGTVSDANYTGQDGPMEIINNAPGIHACAVVGRSNADIRSKAKELAAVATQRVWYVCPNSATVNVSAAITERDGLTGGRLSYWFNHVYKTDPVTRQTIVEEPYVVALSILSQTEPYVHPGDYDNSVLTSAIRKVHLDLSADIRDQLDRAGISFMLADIDANGNSVFIPGTAYTCDRTINNRDLDGRYMKDFILDAVSHRLKSDQYKGNTRAVRAARAAAVSAFFDTLARQETYIQMSEDGKPQYSYLNDSSVNNPNEQALGTQREVAIVRLVPKNKVILLDIGIGVDATVSER